MIHVHKYFDDEENANGGAYFLPVDFLKFFSASWSRPFFFYRYCIEREGRALIADDMGLGKTLQAICVACYYRRDWPVLVVCPASVKTMWAEVERANLSTWRRKQMNFQRYFSSPFSFFFFIGFQVLGSIAGPLPDQRRGDDPELRRLRFGEHHQLRPLGEEEG